VRLPTSSVCLLALALVLAPALGPGASAATRSPDDRGEAGDAGIAMNFQAIEIPHVVQRVATATGYQFIYGDDLQGRVSITVKDRVTKEEAFQLLNAALFGMGFVALEISKDAYKIVPVARSLSSAPMSDREPEAGGEQQITTLLHLEFADANQVAGTLKNFSATGGIALAYPETNTVILVGTEAQLRRLMIIARSIDSSSGDDLMVRVIRHRSVERVEEMVYEIFNESPLATDRVEVWADPRTSTLVARATKRRLIELREFLDEIDQRPEGIGEIEVIRIRNRDAEDVAEILRSLTEAASPQRRAVVRGAPKGVAQVGEHLSGRDVAITVDRATRSLIVRADRETMEAVLRVVEMLDRIPPRIVVEVVVFQLSRPSAFVFGVDFVTPINNPKSKDDLIVVLSSNTSGDPTSPDPAATVFGRFSRDPIVLPVTTIGGIPVAALPIPTDALGASIQAGEAQIYSNVLMRPHIKMISGEEHEIFTGNNVPIPVAATQGTQVEGQAGIAQPRVGLTTSQNIERQDVGVRLRVRPVLGEEGGVTVELDLEVSEVVDSIAGDVNQVGPTLEKRDLQVKVNLREGEYALVGMHIDRKKVTSVIGMPILMNMPVLGFLFRTTKTGVVDTEFLVVLNARVLRTREEDIAESIRRRIAFQRAIARMEDLTTHSSAPYAVLLETLDDEDAAHQIASTFAEDGFTTRVSDWEVDGEMVYDVYVTDLGSFVEAGELAQRFADAGWDSADIAILPTANELEGE
jgi:general secretion pathway protein D